MLGTRLLGQPTWSRSVYFALFCYYFISLRTQVTCTDLNTQLGAVCSAKKKNRNQLEKSRHDAIVNIP